MSRAMGALAVVAVVVASLAIFSGPAYAHERRTVGPYQFVVGFLNEPAFGSSMNGIDLTVTDTRANNKPVEGVEKTLKATVAAGGLAPLDVTLATRFGMPGHYAGYFMPTKEGTYTFTFNGKVEDTAVNEKFESGPGRFGDVESTTALQYPTKVPTGAELAGKLDQLQTLVIASIVVGVLALLASGAGLVMRRA
jgi:hypothetical protein